MSGPKLSPIQARWEPKVVRSDGCWSWSGRHDGEGYARLDVKLPGTRHDWRDKGAHIISWEIANGPVPDGCVVHHTCENKGCVNPAHLEAMPRAHHQSSHQRREVCKAGLHPMADAYVHPRTGKRNCRACSTIRAREKNRERRRRD